LNNIVITGRLTKDIELRKTQRGRSVTSFSVAVRRSYRDANGEYLTDFFDCVAWEKQAEFLRQYFSKGDYIGITGSLETRSYEKDGQKRTAFEIKVASVDFVSSKESSEPKQSVSRTDDRPKVTPQSFGQGDFTDINTDEGDLPF